MGDTNTSPVLCSIEGCGGVFLAFGLCPKHYHRFHRHGSPYMATTSPKFYCVLNENTAALPLRNKRGDVICVTLIDMGDADYLNRWRWSLSPSGYAYRCTTIKGKQVSILLSRVLLGILGKDPTLQSDHVNRSPLDNRRDNLRIASPAENSSNRGGVFERARLRYQKNARRIQELL